MKDQRGVELAASGSSFFYGLQQQLPAAGEEEEERQMMMQQGDLADMVRSSVNLHRRRGSVICSYNYNHHHDQIWSLTNADANNADDEIVSVDHYHHRNSTPAPMMSSCECLLDDGNGNNIIVADPFTMMMTNTTADQHPLRSNNDDYNNNNRDNTTSSGRPTSSVLSNTWQIKPPPINCNGFSQMLHISTTNKDMLDEQQKSVQQVSSSSFAVLAAGGGVITGDDHIHTTSSTYSPSGHGGNMHCGTAPSASGCDTLLHVSSPRNPAIKRSRKGLTKKVVCIPAPAPANSRPSGEVVPSDLWAWRKYGQKPIKGSPYPRGYYRCSSSKGCSARKQVERSRTDPNMLVITYTSEHNHPWPTQRNALAGSTRSHPSSKQNANNVNASSASSSWTSGVVLVDDQIMKRTSCRSGGPVDQTVTFKQQKVDDNYNHVDAINTNRDCEEGQHWPCSYKKTTTYRPTRSIEFEEYNEQSVLQEDDFFAELGEIAGRDHHNGFSSFLMEDYSSSERHDNAVI